MSSTIFRGTEPSAELGAVLDAAAQAFAHLFVTSAHDALPSLDRGLIGDDGVVSSGICAAIASVMGTREAARLTPEQMAFCLGAAFASYSGGARHADVMATIFAEGLAAAKGHMR